MHTLVDFFLFVTVVLVFIVRIVLYRIVLHCIASYFIVKHRTCLIFITSIFKAKIKTTINTIKTILIIIIIKHLIFDQDPLLLFLN